MKIDIVGRVRNTKLPLTRPLLPVFEAVINSLQSIEVSPRRKNGRVEIVIKRDQLALTEELVSTATERISGVLVIDNGIGFNDANYQSFLTSDSTLKVTQGGKGIGRFLWLKAFESVRVESVYEQDGEKHLRSFHFVLSGDGVESEVVTETSRNARVETRVHLQGYKEKYEKNVQRRLRTIGQRVVEHCLSYFIHTDCARVRLQDEDETIDLNDLYAELFKKTAQEDVVEIKGHTFSVLHLRMYPSDEPQHRLHYCAHRREVISENLATYLPNLASRIHDEDGKPFMWSTYVFGNYLDDHVSPERQEFSFPMETPDPIFPEAPSLQEIRNMLLPVVSERLAPYLGPIQERKVERLESFVAEHPQYRPVLKHRPDVLRSLPPDLPQDKLDIEFYKVRRELEDELRADSHALVESAHATPASLQRIIDTANDLNQANLVKYVIDRRIILDVLDKALSSVPDGSYSLEESIHKAVFPLKTTSDDVFQGQQNLWVIDERLAYHYYLASDTPLRKQSAIVTDSDDRPDLIIFNAPIALSEGSHPFSSIVIIEFKRPMRKGYTDDDNPISQVLRYVREVRSGRALDKSGRPMEVGDDVPFYCYILCDLTQKIKHFAEEAGYTKSPDAMGYFGFNPALKAYVEVISYNKMVGDAKKRNRVFFDKLNLPML